LLPGVGNVVYLPVMVGRLMLSLRKAASSRDDGGSFGEPTVSAGLRFDRRGLVGTGDEMRLETLVSRNEEAQSRA